MSRELEKVLKGAAEAADAHAFRSQFGRWPDPVVISRFTLVAGEIRAALSVLDAVTISRRAFVSASATTVLWIILSVAGLIAVSDPADGLALGGIIAAAGALSTLLVSGVRMLVDRRTAGLLGGRTDEDDSAPATIARVRASLDAADRLTGSGERAREVAGCLRRARVWLDSLERYRL